MGFGELGERNWSRMSISEREYFLGELAKAISRRPSWWGGLNIQAIARISSFDDLPGDLRGRLILAMTEDGFSIAEQARTQKIIGGIGRKPTSKKDKKKL